jgi:glycerate-2-kinase
MALALAPARTFCFAVSDVPGDDLASIGSGPCVADPTRVQHIMEILKRVDLFGKIAPSFRQYLLDTARGVIPETPKDSHPAFAHVDARVIASNAIALNAAAAAARRHGFDTLVEDEPLVGDAAEAGARVADVLLTMGVHDNGGATHCRLWGGETTVSLRGPAPAGGRCQELALAAAQRLATAGERASSIAILAAGTDGRDGTTNAAGAIIDGATWDAIRAAAHDPAASLRMHESHAALASVNALFSPGLTGTNVMDVVIGLVN